MEIALDEHKTDEKDISSQELETGYTVSVDSFSGPLDLLLYLVSKSELEINDISVSDIADQFIETIKNWEEINLDIASDFISMAATLLELKSRSIAPLSDDEEEDDDEFFDPHADLIKQLLAFRRCKDEAIILEELENARNKLWRRSFNETIPDDEDEANSYSLSNADPYELYKLWDIIQTNIEGKGPQTIQYDDIPISDRINHLEAIMESAREGELSWLLKTVDTTVQRIGIVVALMECIKQQSVEAIQHEQYGSVFLRYKDEHDRFSKIELPELEEETKDTSVKKKRRKKIPLVTYQTPELTEEEIEQETFIEIEEEVITETDDDKFKRELNIQTNVDDILKVTGNLDENLMEYLISQGVVEENLTGIVDEFAMQEKVELAIDAKKEISDIEEIQKEVNQQIETEEAQEVTSEA